MSDVRAVPWFYHPHELVPDAPVRLDAEEARHASGARRLRVDQAVCLFDGRGVIAEGVIAAMGDRGRAVDVAVRNVYSTPPLLPAVHLASAIPKSDRQGVLLDMATQLGATSFSPLLCERSVVQPGPQAEERWRRICVEACKQSRRAHLPAIGPPERVVERLQSAEPSVWLAHVGGEPPMALLNRADPLPSSFTILIGPEGGFTDEEVAHAEEAGARIVGLGERILRIETAAVSLLALVRLARGG